MSKLLGWGSKTRTSFAGPDDEGSMINPNKPKNTFQGSRYKENQSYGHPIQSDLSNM